MLAAPTARRLRTLLPMRTPAPFTLREASALRGPLHSSRPVLYTHMLCPYAQRVLLTLLLKAPPGGFDVVHVDLSSKPSWFTRDVNPRGLVPALVHARHPDGALLESLQICRQLDALVPQPPLTPQDARAAAQMQQLLQQADSIVSAGLDVVAGSTARHWGVGSRPSAAQKAAFARACQQLQGALQACGGPFLTGASPSLADVVLYPFFERYSLCLQLAAGGQGTSALAALPHGAVVARWLDTMAASAGCRLASPDAAFFTAELRAHASLDFFDYQTYRAAQLHPQLAECCWGADA